VDKRAAYVGGFNVSQLNSREANGEARWRDTHVRLTGPVVEEAASAYLAFAWGDLEWHGHDSRSVYLLTNHTRACRYRLRCVLREQLAEARKRIWLTTPYFVPDSAMQRELCAAARRGVDVRVLVAGKNDVRLVQWAARAAYALLLREGVRLFEYQPRTLHAKSLLVDDDWGTIGTANFDYRSFFINYELNLVARSKRLNAALTELFETDLRAAREVLEQPWASRPVLGRAAELVGWTVRRWL
jgi:cardiolipin synthase